MLGADIGMPELARGSERPCQRILKTRRDPDLGGHLVGRAVAAAALLIELPAEVVQRHLELVENGADDVALGKRVEKVLGIDLIAAELGGAACGALQDFLRMRAQAFGERGAASASASAP